MERTDVNPWEWSKAFGFSQAVDVAGASHVLLCSGQTATGDDGSPPTTSDMGQQVEKALSNLATVLAAAGMTMANVVKLTLYTTDLSMDDLDEVRAWLGYDKINLSGGSYGTRAAQVFARRHPG